MFAKNHAEVLTAPTMIGMQQRLQFDSSAVRRNPTILLEAMG